MINLIDKIANFFSKEEIQTCPRRLEGPWSNDILKDRWVTEAKGFRTCSFCGSLHPEDFIRLVKMGFEIGPTDKSYKLYAPVADKHVKGAGKFYTQHFEQGFGEEFWRLVENKQVLFGYPGHLYVPLYVPKTKSY